MSIGSRIKEARERKKLTQVDLANVLGVSKGTIGNYESDISSPKDSILFNLINVLGVDANFIFQDEIKKAPIQGEPKIEANLSDKDKDKYILDLVSQMNLDTRDKAIAFLESVVLPINKEKHQ